MWLYSRDLLQVINNACATQAILSILLNCNNKDVSLGETLTSFKEFAQSFDPAVSGKNTFTTGHFDLIVEIKPCDFNNRPL